MKFSPWLTKTCGLFAEFAHLLRRQKVRLFNRNTVISQTPEDVKCKTRGPDQGEGRLYYNSDQACVSRMGVDRAPIIVTEQQNSQT